MDGAVVPSESHKQYEATFGRLLEWMKTKYGANADRRKPTETDVKAYIHYLANEREGRDGRVGLAPTSLQTYVCELKKMMMWKFGWPETSKCWLIAEAHVKDAKKTHVPVQSSTFEWEEIVPFFKSQEEWPKNEKDKNLLVATMVSAAIVAGARTNELNLMTRDCLSIDEATGETLIKLPWRKTKKNGPQSFRVAADVDGPLSPNRCAPQYLALRREAETKYRAEISSEPDSPLWYYVERGKMVNKVVGKNAFGTFPSYIAAKMGLDNPERYTGYACRRSAASHAAEECTTLEMMAHFGWSNAQTAMIYVNQTKSAQRTMSRKITAGTNSNRRKQWQHRPTAADGFQQRQTNIGAAYYDHRAYSRQLRNNDDIRHDTERPTIGVTVVRRVRLQADRFVGVDSIDLVVVFDVRSSAANIRSYVRFVCWSLFSGRRQRHHHQQASQYESTEACVRRAQRRRRRKRSSPCQRRQRRR